MSPKSGFFAALFVLLGFTLRFASATPPACVLACVNKQPNLQKYQDICKSGVKAVYTCLGTACKKEFYDDAVSSYAASCQEAGIKVVEPTSIPSPSHSSPPTSSPTGTATTTTTGSHGDSTASSTGSRSESTGASATPTGGEGHGSASTVYYNGMLVFLAVFAAAAAL